MRKILCLSAVLALLVSLAPAPAAERVQDDTARQLRLLDAAVDILNHGAPGSLPEQRAGYGENLNQAFVALTGEAINPLFGITALGIYNYIRTPEGLRDSLPIYDQPEVWIPLLVIIFLMLFNSTLCEALPFLKVPLNALGDIVNKAGAVAVLPLVVKMFADSVAPQAGESLSAAVDALFPAAYAAEGGVGAVMWHSFGWLAGAAVGTVIYLCVWLTFNVVDVLILICPFPGIDALLKSFRLGVMGLLVGSYQLSPAAAALLAAAILLVSLLVAGWSFRLSVFGLVFSTDILFFRRGRISPDDGVAAFSAAGMKSRSKLPIRTLGRLVKNGDGGLAFVYRPWLVMSKRAVELGQPSEYLAGKGLVSAFLVAKGEEKELRLRLPPRYRGMDEALAGAFGLAGTTAYGAGGTLRAWLAGIFGRTQETA